MPYEKLLKKALDLLSKRNYTVLRLKEKLFEFYKKQIEKNKLPEATKSEQNKEIKKVLTRLKELRYLNDTEYAKIFIGNRIEFRPKGKYMLKRELKNKGIHPDLAERVVEGAEIDELENAKKALNKKAKAWQSSPPRKQKEKALRFLASRGFNFDAIYKAIDSWYNKAEVE
ncbi:RecX family transcriptional regulator [Candidatus Peregrinibacteria bacterium]|jgi:regulatory protein|nr:RecX family transcriptional regulator [Candidatus Peregrinibacteria bacterium]MBT4147710.1 RecX family transcriptional regulator [Candidatus Peregrinibacteria bacterium]MBT4365788.1 RecX family transcriptional regulator [Candidatus Peregrinibacteria bacterium]MBT4455745.1 RecX family transcriptional regulator [Candidatus Peregrinibacteria bacterium]